MGAIGSGPFENDDAQHFLTTLERLPPADRPAQALDALDTVLLSTGYVEAPQMCEAVAAAAAVGACVNPAAAQGEPPRP